jgi:hypothetical protein
MESPIALTQISTSFNNAFTAAQVPLPDSPKRKIRSVSLDVQGSVLIAKLNTDGIYQQIAEAEKLMDAGLAKLKQAKQTCAENIWQLERLQNKGTCYTYYATESHKELSGALEEEIEKFKAILDAAYTQHTKPDADALTRTMDDLVARTQNGTYYDSDEE